MSHQVARIAPARVAAGPPVGIAEAASAETPDGRYAHLVPADRVPARTPVVLVWRGEQLSSPDVITVSGASVGGGRIELRIEMRRFDGPLHGNVVTVPIVEVGLGPLEPGHYDATIEVTTLRFEDFDHPERAGSPRVDRSTFSFVVV